MRLAEITAVAEHAGVRRRAAGKQRSAGGIAERELAVIAIETHTALGEGVDVRRPGRKSAGVATEFHPHVVGHDEEHIGFPVRSAAGCLRRGRAGQRGRGGCGRDGAEELAARPALGGTHYFILRQDEGSWQGSRSSPFLATPKSSQVVHLH